MKSGRTKNPKAARQRRYRGPFEGWGVILPFVRPSEVPANENNPDAGKRKNKSAGDTSANSTLDKDAG